MAEYFLQTPLSQEDISALSAGDMAYLSGTVYTARDAAHKRLVEMLDAGQALPFDLEGQAVYYAGPCPAKPGMVIGSVGPTTSGRMDAYSPRLIKQGLKTMIGKGLRDQAVKKAIVENGGIYFAAIGGAAALMSQCVKEAEVIAFEDLGAEAIRRLRIVKLPVVVAIDSKGRDIYQLNPPRSHE